MKLNEWIRRIGNERERRHLLAGGGGTEKCRCCCVREKSQARVADLLGLLGLLGQKHSLDVGQHTALGDGDTGEELVELLVVADGQLQVAGDDPGLLVVAGSVAGQLEHLGSQVLHDCSQVDWGAGTYALSIVALPEQAVDSADGELQTSAG
jgi:hypothetical protein